MFIPAHRRWWLATCSLVLCSLLLMSCSRTTSLIPHNPADVTPHLASLPLAAADLVIDTDTGTLSLLERAGMAAGDPLVFAATPLFRRSALRLEGIRRLPDSRLGLTLAIRHPVAAPKPGTIDPAFHATDVLGILVFDGADALSIGSERVHAGWLAAHGYTDLLQQQLTSGFQTTATLHPYVLLSADGREPNYDPATLQGWTDLAAPRGLNVLPQGSDWRSTELVLDLPPGEHRVRLAIQASIQQVPVGNTEAPLPAQYAYPEGNLATAWGVGAEVWNNDLTAGTPASGAELDVLVYDWQHGTPATSPWSVTDSKSMVRQVSDVASVRVLLPAVGIDLTQPGSAAVSGTGRPGSPLRFTFPLTNQKGVGAGTYWALIDVRDTRGAEGLRDSDGQVLTAPQGFRTGQVVPVTVFPATGPERLVGLQLASEHQIFVGPHIPVPLTAQGRLNSGALIPLDQGSIEHRLLSGSGALLTGATVERTLPRDERGTALLESRLTEGPALIRGRTTLVLGDPYADQVVDYAPLCGAGGSGANPQLALGGPRGAGRFSGNADHIVSLGYGGSLTLAFTDGGMLDRPGPDFIVFENAFEIGQDPDQIFTETVRVEVSANGTDWIAFPMDYRPIGDMPWRRPWNFAGLAGITPVLANVDTNSLDPTNLAEAGGDHFDLATIGLPYAAFVRLTGTGIDSSSPCYSGCPLSNRMTDLDGDLIDDEGKRATCSSVIGGPDIDAVAIVAGHQGFPE